jgi:imidazole glycerol-phosphate synthase subunit HisH
MHDTKVTIVDYGMGNIRSVFNAFTHLGCSVEITNKPADLKTSELIVLPGVGAFGEAMESLKKLNLIEELNFQVKDKKKPFLGICLGMQLIAESSKEKGGFQGLGWIPGHVIPIKVQSDLRIPHMGWNEISNDSTDELLKGFPRGLNFYFVHSYWFNCGDKNHVHSTVNYGSELTASIKKENIFATQFHPERSHHNGLRLLENYLKSIS